MFFNADNEKVARFLVFLRISMIRTSKNTKNSCVFLCFWCIWLQKPRKATDGHRMDKIKGSRNATPRLRRVPRAWAHGRDPRKKRRRRKSKRRRRRSAPGMGPRHGPTGRGGRREYTVSRKTIEKHMNFYVFQRGQ